MAKCSENTLIGTRLRPLLARRGAEPPQRHAARRIRPRAALSDRGQRLRGEDVRQANLRQAAPVAQRARGNSRDRIPILVRGWKYNKIPPSAHGGPHYSCSAVQDRNFIRSS